VTFVTKEPQAYTLSSVTFTAAGGAYIILQFICTVWSAVKGLQLHAFQRLTVQTFTPQPNETTEAYRVRITDASIACHLHNESVTNKKASQLKLAHRAMKNALGMLLVIVLALGSIAIYNASQGSP
jgi:hypothetical protein